MARVRSGLQLVPGVVAQMGKCFARARNDDLRSFGNEGALIAGRTFDPELGVPFHRWATLKIRGAILDGLRAEADLPRRLHAQIRALLGTQKRFARDDGGAATRDSAVAADARLDGRLAAIATAYAAGRLFARGDATLQSLMDSRATPEEALEREQLRSAIRAAIAERPAEERTLLERYYFGGMTMSEASGGASRPSASRLHARAIHGVAYSLRRNQHSSLQTATLS